MMQRIAREWLWLLGAFAVTIIWWFFDGDQFSANDAFMVPMIMYGLAAFVRVTIWAIKTVRGGPTQT